MLALTISAMVSSNTSVKSVSMNPGATTLTVMPRDPISFASDFENPIKPAFEAA